MISVVYAAGIVLVVTLVGLAVDWRKLRRRLERPRSYVNAMVDPERYADLPGPVDILSDAGWPVELIDLMAQGPFDVTTQTYRNGTTQIWLKRRPAA